MSANKRQVLLIAPLYMDLYKDIVAELETRGYAVDFVPEQSQKGDPCNVRGYNMYKGVNLSKEKFDEKNRQRWVEILEQHKEKYDILLVIDGQSIDKILFEELKRRNSHLRSFNYLFDTTSGVYEFQHNFPLFDKVFTFDMVEAEKYNISYLPIYWIEATPSEKFHYDVFGLGALSQPRYELFKAVKNVCEKKEYSYFLKLLPNFHIKYMSLYKIRNVIRTMLGVDKRNIVSAKALTSEFIIEKGMAPSEFREYVYSSSIIVDTSAPHQTGLTARFMWALGAGKKIITTNQFVMRTSLFDPDKVMVFKEDTSMEQVYNFMSNNADDAYSCQEEIESYRIDRWLNTILQ